MESNKQNDLTSKNGDRPTDSRLTAVCWGILSQDREGMGQKIKMKKRERILWYGKQCGDFQGCGMIGRVGEGIGMISGVGGRLHLGSEQAIQCTDDVL